MRGDATSQDVIALLELNNQHSKERHEDLKEFVGQGFNHVHVRLDDLNGRVKTLEKQEKPLITLGTLKWAGGIATAALITIAIGMIINGS